MMWVSDFGCFYSKYIFVYIFRQWKVSLVSFWKTISENQWYRYFSVVNLYVYEEVEDAHVLVGAFRKLSEGITGRDRKYCTVVFVVLTQLDAMFYVRPQLQHSFHVCIVCDSETINTRSGQFSPRRGRRFYGNLALLFPVLISCFPFPYRLC